MRRSGGCPPDVILPEPHLLRRRLLESPVLRAHIVSIIWIGSRSRSRDVHELSDLDVQIILDQPDPDATRALARVLADYPDADLSILYRSDIFDATACLDFQDGTKGAFFIQVLADGVLLHGEDVYGPIAAALELPAVRPSLMFTIREYLGRLRVMATRGGEPTYTFKKYCVKLLKDVLVHDGRLALVDMSGTTSAATLELAEASYGFDADECRLVRRLADVDDVFDAEDRAIVLGACERLVRDLRRGSP